MHYIAGLNDFYGQHYKQQVATAVVMPTNPNPQPQIGDWKEHITSESDERVGDLKRSSDMLLDNLKHAVRGGGGRVMAGTTGDPLGCYGRHYRPSGTL